MKRKQSYKISSIIAFIVMASTCFAQDGFLYKAELADVKQPGFYKIPLSPSVIAKCRYNLEDLRILDDKNNQAAYIIKQDAARFTENKFVEFPIISKAKGKDKQTHITIENSTGKAITDLLLITSNMDAKRLVNISGSNNLQDWYIIKEGIGLDNYFSKQEEEVVQTILLPVVNYKYFQVTVIGEDILPFNIVKAGIYRESYTQGKYILVPYPSIQQIDSIDKKSYAQLTFNEPYPIDKFILEVEGPKLFKRNLAVYLGNLRSSKTPFSTYINSNKQALFLAGMKSKEFLLVINNDDNIPLKVKSAEAFQLNQYLLAYLDTGKNYHLAFADPLAKAPVYDLTFFKDSIGKNTAELEVGSIQQTSITIEPVTAKPKDSSKKFLWSIIAVISILLLLFTYKMTKEISKTKQDADI